MVALGKLLGTICRRHVAAQHGGGSSHGDKEVYKSHMNFTSKVLLIWFQDKFEKKKRH